MKSQYCKLSRNEIDFIKDEVKRCEITFSHLEEELLDHLCCMVEEMMSEGRTFESAFEAVKKDVGMNSLKSIEVETLILINKKFQAMRKTMKISGIIGLSAIVLSSVMKIMHLPGSSFLVILAFAALLLAYLPALVLTLKNEKILKRKTHLSYVGIAASSILLLSLLFTILRFPYADLIQIISWLGMLVFLVMLFNSVMKSEEERVLNLSMLLFFAVLFVVNIAFSLIDLYNPRLSKITLETNIDVSIKLYEHKSEKAYQHFGLIANNPKAVEIAEIKTKTAFVSNHIKEICNAIFATKESQQNYQKQILKSDVLTSEIRNSIHKLESEIGDYREFMLTKSDLQPDLKSFVTNSLEFGWYGINNTPPIVYNNLQRLCRDIKIAEYELLNEIQQSIKIQ